mmetsp:Transcript_126850/g.224795  ORF Transcript_126850/g.224795 Transcript_126850/m.224795 type:complete len:222 (-) Transcript_126850:14-679(-)
MLKTCASAATPRRRFHSNSSAANRDWGPPAEVPAVAFPAALWADPPELPAVVFPADALVDRRAGFAEGALNSLGGADAIGFPASRCRGCNGRASARGDLASRCRGCRGRACAGGDRTFSEPLSGSRSAECSREAASGGSEQALRSAPRRLLELLLRSPCATVAGGGPGGGGGEPLSGNCLAAGWAEFARRKAGGLGGRAAVISLQMLEVVLCRGNGLSIAS